MHSRFSCAIIISLILVLGACSRIEPLVTRVKVEVCPVSQVLTQCPSIEPIEYGVAETLRDVLISREFAVKAATQCRAGIVKWRESYNGCKSRE